VLLHLTTEKHIQIMGVETEAVNGIGTVLFRHTKVKTHSKETGISGGYRRPDLSFIILEVLPAATAGRRIRQ